MNKLLEQFSKFTKEDWNEFDKLKSLAYQPTEEELEAQRIEQEKLRLDTIAYKLSKRGITRPKTITKDFIIGLLTSINAQQFIGDDFDKWIDNQILLFGDIEKAFDDLVLQNL